MGFSPGCRAGAVSLSCGDVHPKYSLFRIVIPGSRSTGDNVDDGVVGDDASTAVPPFFGAAGADADADGDEASTSRPSFFGAAGATWHG